MSNLAVTMRVKVTTKAGGSFVILPTKPHEHNEYKHEDPESFPNSSARSRRKPAWGFGLYYSVYIYIHIYICIYGCILVENPME